MASGELERLFLLELMVYNIQFFSTSIHTPGKTVVKIKFRNYPVFEIGEDDFCSVENGYSDTQLIKFKSGKSCLFSIRKKTGQPDPSYGRQLYLSVSRRSFDEDCEYQLGTVVVELPSRFLTLFDLNGQTMQSEWLKDTFCLRNCQNEPIGVVAFFLRLSCFGKMIVTQFQMEGEDSKTYKFKGDNPMDFPESYNPPTNQTVAESQLASFVPYGNGLYGPGNMVQAVSYISPESVQMAPRGMPLAQGNYNANENPFNMRLMQSAHNYNGLNIGQYGPHPFVNDHYGAAQEMHRGYGDTYETNRLSVATQEVKTCDRRESMINLYLDPNTNLMRPMYEPFNANNPPVNYLPQPMVFPQSQNQYTYNPNIGPQFPPARNTIAPGMNNMGYPFAGGQYGYAGQGFYGNNTLSNERIGLLGQPGPGVELRQYHSMVSPHQNCGPVNPFPFDMKR